MIEIIILLILEGYIKNSGHFIFALVF